MNNRCFTTVENLIPGEIVEYNLADYMITCAQLPRRPDHPLCYLVSEHGRGIWVPGITVVEHKPQYIFHITEQKTLD